MNRYQILFRTLWISFMFSAIIVLIPFLFREGESIHTTIGTGAALLSGFAACATIVVAVLLFQNIHHTNAIEKQIDSINSFLENIKTLELKIYTIDDKGHERYAHLPIKSRQILNHYSMFLGDKFNYPAAFRTDNYFKGLEELSKISNSIYMPAELQQYLSFLGPHVFQLVSESKSPGFIKVTINERFSPNTEDQYWTIDCGEGSVTLKDFIEKMQLAIDAMVEWLHKHSNSKIAFNI